MAIYRRHTVVRDQDDPKAPANLAMNQSPSVFDATANVFSGILNVVREENSPEKEGDSHKGCTSYRKFKQDNFRAILESEKQNTEKMKIALKSFVVAVATKENAVDSRKGLAEGNRIDQIDIMLTERARQEKERDGDEALHEMIKENTKPMIMTNLMIKYSFTLIALMVLILGGVWYYVDAMSYLEVSPELDRSFFIWDHPATINNDKVVLINKEINALEAGEPSTLQGDRRTLTAGDMNEIIEYPPRS